MSTPGNVKRSMSMRELIEATGLPKSMILHYIAQGLLPTPVRTGRNQALYDPACVERLKFIKSIQGAYSFPLDKIRDLLLLRDKGKDMAPLLELDATVFGTASAASLDEEDFMAVTGLDAPQISELLASGLLMPLKEGSYGQEDEEAGKVYAAAFRLGVTVTDLAFYPSLGREIVEREMDLRSRLTGHLPDEEDAAVTTGLTRGARVLRSYVTDKVFQRRVAAMRSLKDQGREKETS